MSSSPEDDVVTVERVTRALAGPLRVWVLEVDASEDGGHRDETLWYQQDSALKHARKDMETMFKGPKPSPQLIDKMLNALRRATHAEFGATKYSLTHRIVCE